MYDIGMTGPVGYADVSGSERLDRAFGMLLFVVASVLLTSIGGLGIVAAPVTLPLLAVVVRRRPTRGFRIASAVIGGLTAAELAWGLLYVSAGEVPVATWLLPAATGVGAAIAFLRIGSARRRTVNDG